MNLTLKRSNINWPFVGDLIIFRSFDTTYLVYHHVTYIITKQWSSLRFSTFTNERCCFVIALNVNLKMYFRIFLI